MKGSRRKTSEAVIIHTVPSVVKEYTQEEPEYLDNVYWKPLFGASLSVDDLLADY